MHYEYDYKSTLDIVLNTVNLESLEQEVAFFELFNALSVRRHIFDVIYFFGPLKKRTLSPVDDGRLIVIPLSLRSY
jgi:hypothetical protein